MSQTRASSTRQNSMWPIIVLVALVVALLATAGIYGYMKVTDYASDQTKRLEEIEDKLDTLEAAVAGNAAESTDQSAQTAETGDSSADASGTGTAADGGVSDEDAAAAGGTVNADGTVTYVVQPGDSLSLISDNFGVTIDDLMILNNLTNASVLSAGMELRVK